MAFKGITFAGQNVTPKNDGGLYQAHYGDGILWGCSMAISGDDLVIQSGEFIAGGRVCHVDGATNVDLSGRLLSTGYIQVIMNYDLSQGEGSQWYTTFVESATTTFPALTQGNINDTDTLYQLELAVIQISGGNLTSIYSSLLYSNVTARGSNIQLFGGASLPQSELDFLFDGDYTGKISNLAGGNIFFTKTTPNNTSTHGLMLGGTDATLSANNGVIYLYPRGWNDGSYGVVIDNNGQLYHPNVEYGSYSSSESVSASANVTVSPGNCTLGKAGLYLVFAVVRYSCSSGNATNRRLGVSSVSGAFGLNTTTFYTGLTAAWEYACMFRWVATSDNERVYLNWMGGGYNGTITAHNLSCFLIY